MNEQMFKKYVLTNPAKQTAFLKSVLNIPGELRGKAFLTTKGQLVNIARQSHYVNSGTYSQFARKIKSLETKKKQLTNLRLQTTTKLEKTKVSDRVNYYKNILQTINSALNNTTLTLESFKIEQQLPSLERARLMSSGHSQLKANKAKKQELNELFKRFQILKR